MDDDNSYRISQNRLTADLRAFMTDNMTAGDIQGLAFEIGIDPNALEGSLADELAVSRVDPMTRRSVLHLLGRALRDTFPADYRLAFSDTLRDDSTAGWADEEP